MYDATLGRFLQRDPSGFAGSGGGRQSLYEYVLDQPTNGTDPTGTYVRWSVDDCSIKIQLLITIYAVNDDVRKAVDLDALATRMANAINTEWNRDQWKTTGSCTVRFDARVVADKEHTSWWNASPRFDNLIAINDNAEYVSNVSHLTRSSGTWSNQEKDWVFAHEAGHLMGLDDEYSSNWFAHLFGADRTSTPNPGKQGHIMAEDNGRVTLEEVQGILDAQGIKCPGCCADNPAAAAGIHTTSFLPPRR
jgi:hypothetical protein